MRYVGGFWVVWVCACLPLALLPYGGAVERSYNGVQQLVANLGPLVGVLLVAGLAGQLVVSTRQPGPDPTNRGVQVSGQPSRAQLPRKPEDCGWSGPLRALG